MLVGNLSLELVFPTFTNFSFQQLAIYHRHLSIIDCLSFVMCPLLAPLLIVFFSFFFLLRSFTVLMKQTRQAVRVIKQSIFRLSISMQYTHAQCLWSWTHQGIQVEEKSSVQFTSTLQHFFQSSQLFCIKTSELSRSV